MPDPACQGETPRSTPQPCPKCGAETGWHGPRYRKPVLIVGAYDRHGCRLEDTPAALEFTCRTCGYVRAEPTKDATPGPPPAPPASHDPGRDVSGFAGSWMRRLLGIREYGSKP